MKIADLQIRVVAAEPHRGARVSHSGSMDRITLFGVCALGFMMTMYALERRHRVFVAAFALGCLLSSAYGFLSGAWPFGVVEAIWALVAGYRYLASRDRIKARAEPSPRSN